MGRSSGCAHPNQLRLLDSAAVHRPDHSRQQLQLQQLPQCNLRVSKTVSSLQQKNWIRCCARCCAVVVRGGAGSRADRPAVGCSTACVDQHRRQYPMYSDD